MNAQRGVNIDFSLAAEPTRRAKVTY